MLREAVEGMQAALGPTHDVVHTALMMLSDFLVQEPQEQYGENQDDPEFAERIAKEAATAGERLKESAKIAEDHIEVLRAEYKRASDVKALPEHSEIDESGERVVMTGEMAADAEPLVDEHVRSPKERIGELIIESLLRMAEHYTSRSEFALAEALYAQVKVDAVAMKLRMSEWDMRIQGSMDSLEIMKNVCVGSVNMCGCVCVCLWGEQ